jgi:hypothetical protein
MPLAQEALLSNKLHPTPLHTPGVKQSSLVMILSSEQAPLMYGMPATNFTRAAGNNGSKAHVRT